MGIAKEQPSWKDNKIPTRPQNYFPFTNPHPTLPPQKIISYLNEENYLNEDCKRAAKSDDDASMGLIPSAHLHFLKVTFMKISPKKLS